MASCKVKGCVDGNISFESGFSGSSFCRRSGNVVHWYIDLQSGTLSKNTWTTIAKMPDGFRPPAQYDFVGVDNSGNNSGAIQVKCHNNGNIQVYATNANGNSVRVGATHIVNP